MAHSEGGAVRKGHWRGAAVHTGRSQGGVARMMHSAGAGHSPELGVAVHRVRPELGGAVHRVRPEREAAVRMARLEPEAAVRMVRLGKGAGSGIGLAAPAAEVDTGPEVATDSPDTADMVPGRELVRELVRAVDNTGARRGSGGPGRTHQAAGRRSPAGGAAGRSTAIANS